MCKFSDTPFFIKLPVCDSIFIYYNLFAEAEHKVATMKKIAYVQQVGHQVGLYDNTNHEYTRVHGQLVSYTSDFVATTNSKTSINNRVYNAKGHWIRDVHK